MKRYVHWEDKRFLCASLASSEPQGTEFHDLSISNKNLPQPPACLQDFLFCLTTSIFKLVEFLSVRNCHSYCHSPSSTPLWALDYVSSYIVVLLLFYDFWWSVSLVPSQKVLKGSDWHKGMKGRNSSQSFLLVSRLESTLDFAACYFFPPSHLCPYFKYDLHIWLLWFVIGLYFTVGKHSCSVC